MPKCDFSGYATKVNLRCSDGRTIRKDAFKMNDGQRVPLVWQHQRNDPDNILGHADLENRADGVYAYCSFNDSPKARSAKLLVEHGDIRQMSIYANQLQQEGSNVMHGNIREVSLVVAGANPGAFIDNLQIQHADGSITDLDDEAVIYTGLDLEHADDTSSSNASEKSDDSNAKAQNGSNEKKSGKTAKEIFDSLNEDQKNLLYAMVGAAMAEGGSDKDAEQSAIEEDDDMKYNVFEGQSETASGKYVLTHEDQTAILEDAKRCKSFKQALEHFCEDKGLEHGITDLESLFPDPKLANGPEPEFISRPMDWVSKVWNGFKKSPFSRIKWVYADITMDEARAKGYIKGHRKVEEQFSLLKRTTQPTTVYKKQKFDRDDIIDLTDFNLIAWVQREMRMMLDEELSRAALIGDGRNLGEEDKINEDCIRPIYHEDPMYAMRFDVPISKDSDTTDKSNAIVEAAIRSRKDYRGSGNPTLYTTTDTLNDLMLAMDKNGRRIYKTEAELASAMRVSGIVEVPVMENLEREGEDGKQRKLLGIIVNLSDYTIGSDRGGAVTMYDDFDIDYNKQTYLIETRLSGSLNKPYSAIILEQVEEDKPVKLTVTVPGPKEKFFEREANSFQNDILMGSDFLCGKLYHQTGWTEFSSNVNKQEGYYVCLKAEATEQAQIYTRLINGNTKEEKQMTDGYCVYRISDPETQKIRITAKKDEKVVAVKTLSLTNLFMI